MTQQPQPRAPSDDATDRDAHLLRRNRTLLKLATSQAFERGDIDTNLRELTEAAAEVLGVDRVSVWLLEEGDTRLRCVDAFQCGDGRHEHGDELVTAEYPAFLRALRVHRCIAAADAHADPRTNEFGECLVKLSIQSVLAAPMRIGARVLGVVCHETIGARRTWNEEDELLAASIAELASLAVEAARLHTTQADVVRKNRELAILQNLFELALSTPSPHEALEHMVRAIAPALGFPCAALELLDEPRGGLVLHASAAWPQRTLPPGADAPKSALGTAAVRAARTVVLRDDDAAPAARPDPAAGVRTLVAVPLVLGSGVIGVLSLGHGERIDVDQETLALAARIAGALAVQVDRYRSFEAARRLEERLRESQKLEAVGTLAGGIAHDFNNLLTGILGYAYLLKQSATPGDDVYRAVEVITSAAERAAELTQQLLGFARKGKHRNVPVDVHALVREVCGLCSRTMHKNIAIVQDLRASNAIVIGDPGQIHQMLLNLAINARDALPQGGRIVFATQELQDGGAGGEPGAPARRLVLEVSDTGVGIAPEHLSRVFDPFFTTKEPGKGTGMGLAMVYGIVQGHGGTIDIESQLGRGTKFRVVLPHAAGAASPDGASTLEIPVRGTGHVLVVDDDQLVADTAAEFLRSLGYTVSMAASGAEAIERYLQARPPIEVVLLDLVMPRMGGRECLRALRRIDPSARVVLASGWQLGTSQQEAMTEGALEFVRKPYAIAPLSDAVARAMASRATVEPR
jgi:signal transduction histidine kinase/CheY-like chemotaxis protein